MNTSSCNDIPSRDFDGLNLEYEDCIRRGKSENRVASLLSLTECTPRESLLFQLLAAKKVLERKAINPKAGIVAALQVLQTDEEQKQAYELSALKEQVLLCQRKNSAAIKLACLEREETRAPYKRSELIEMTKLLAALSLQIQQIEDEKTCVNKQLEFRQRSQMSLLQDLGGIDMMTYSSSNSISETPHNRGKRSVNCTSSLPILNHLPSSTAPTSYTSSFVDRKDRILAFLTGRKVCKRTRKFWSFHGLTKAEQTKPLISDFDFDRPTPRSLRDEILVNKIKTESEQSLLSKVTLENEKKKEVSSEALHEMEAFKILIDNYYERNSRN